MINLYNLKGGDRMKYLIMFISLGFLAGCDDKDDDDTGIDTAAVVDTSESESE
jgi:hypothetical protein